MSELIQVTGRTTVYAIIGDPLGHSLTPLALNTAFRLIGIDALNVPIVVKPEHLGEVVYAMRHMGIAGLVVTAPHKSSILTYVDSSDATVRSLGAANVVKAEDGRLSAQNNDGRAFVRAMEDVGGMAPEGLEIALLGAGGAARALARELALAGANIHILNRTLERAESIRASAAAWGAGHHIASVSGIDSNEGLARLADADVIINATSLGLHKDDPSPVELPPGLRARLVCDLIYFPVETPLLAQAGARGLSTLNGLDMMVQSNADTVEIWTGRRPPVRQIRQVVHQALLERQTPR